jgi:hypothetical protein
MPRTSELKERACKTRASWPTRLGHWQVTKREWRRSILDNVHRRPFYPANGTAGNFLLAPGTLSLTHTVARISSVSQPWFLSALGHSVLLVTDRRPNLARSYPRRSVLTGNELFQAESPPECWNVKCSSGVGGPTKPAFGSLEDVTPRTATH